MDLKYLSGHISLSTVQQDILGQVRAHYSIQQWETPIPPAKTPSTCPLHCHVSAPCWPSVHILTVSLLRWQTKVYNTHFQIVYFFAFFYFYCLLFHQAGRNTVLHALAHTIRLTCSHPDVFPKHPMQVIRCQLGEGGCSQTEMEIKYGLIKFKEILLYETFEE